MILMGYYFLVVGFLEKNPIGKKFMNIELKYQKHLKTKVRKCFLLDVTLVLIHRRSFWKHTKISFIKLIKLFLEIKNLFNYFLICQMYPMLQMFYGRMIYLRFKKKKRYWAYLSLTHDIKNNIKTPIQITSKLIKKFVKNTFTKVLKSFCFHFVRKKEI